MTKLIALALLALSSAPAFAQNVYCIDNQDGDKLIELVVENGQVKGATFTNQDHGSFDDRALKPGEYSYNGATLTFEGDTYSCQ
jgi:hypothetical protein